MYILNDGEKITALVEAAVMVLRDSGAVDAESVSQVLKGYAPQLWHRFGAQYVESLAQKLQSEHREASLRFTELFHSYNGKYFNSQLPPYKVSVVYLAPEISSIDLDHRCIYICFLEDASEMIHSLLAMMAHAALNSNQYDESWLQEMRRLQGLGAPVLQARIVW